MTVAAQADAAIGAKRMSIEQFSGAEASSSCSSLILQFRDL